MRVTTEEPTDINNKYISSQLHDTHTHLNNIVITIFNSNGYTFKKRKQYNKGSKNYVIHTHNH